MNHRRKGIAFEPTGRRDLFIECLAQVLAGAIAHSTELAQVPVCDCSDAHGASEFARDELLRYAEHLADTISEILQEMSVVGVMVRDNRPQAQSDAVH